MKKLITECLRFLWGGVFFGKYYGRKGAKKAQGEFWFYDHPYLHWMGTVLIKFLYGDFSERCPFCDGETEIIHINTFFVYRCRKASFAHLWTNL